MTDARLIRWGRPDAPNVFASAIGTDHCASLVNGLAHRLQGQPPDAWARVEILVANARMQRRLQALFADRGPSLLPRIRPVMALGSRTDLIALPAAVSPLRLRLELVDLIGKLLDSAPDLAPRSALYDLADSLADLMGEMFEEGVSPDRLATLDIGEHSRHWERAQAFLAAVARYFEGGESPLTPEARHASATAMLIRAWDVAPPSHPVIVAGSTGSRGMTARLMEAVARLPQGAVVLPGLDRDLPPDVWTGLLAGRRSGLAGEDHPQYRLARFARTLGLDPWDIPDWHGTDTARSGAAQAQARAVSLALRPAPVTDQWRREGPALADLGAAFAPVTLVEAPTPQQEANAIALRLREAAETGQRAALISADRRLTRQVAAALDRWGILPDDSAGVPLSQTPSGRFMRHVADLLARPLDAEGLIVLLKHPICHSGQGRGPHLRRTRDLELELLRRQPGLPSRAALTDWAQNRTDDPDAVGWVAWLCAHALAAPPHPATDMQAVVARHCTLADRLAAGALDADGSGRLFSGEDGAEVSRLMADLTAEAPHGSAMPATDYRDLFSALTEDREARQVLRPHATILIWGTQEARVQGVDLAILAGLNEGSWPRLPAADPWLNRPMRAEAGLRLPDRVIGLAAHDFQQAIAAGADVWLTRSIRDDETDTVPSRWLNRLTNMLRGSGPDAAAALEAMQVRGAQALRLARTLATPAPDDHVSSAPRPAPVPPVAARPAILGVTELERLIRDPYAIYARRVLHLNPLDPLRQNPDAALRGTVLHAVMKRFVEMTPGTLPHAEMAKADLLRIASEVLAEQTPWAVSRRLWLGRLARAADWIVATEAALRRAGDWARLETFGTWDIPGTGVTLRGTVDRIDRLGDGTYAIHDYKTGKPPTQKQERAFNKQLWVEALMAEAGAFGIAPPVRVRHLSYIGIGSTPERILHDVTPQDLARMRDQLDQRLRHMRAPGTGFTSRRAMERLGYTFGYDQLARFGEWDETAPPVPIPVGGTP